MFKVLVDFDEYSNDWIVRVEGGVGVKDGREDFATKAGAVRRALQIVKEYEARRSDKIQLTIYP